MNEEIVFPSKEYPHDVHVVEVGEKKILLIGTAHISQESVDLVKEVIESEEADCICIELDDKRYHALSNQKQWQSLDLKAIIKSKQLSTLLASMLMASYQKRLGGKLGVTPGAELMAAANTARAKHLPISLCDRDIRITLRRAWKSTGFFKKSYLISSLFASLFDNTEVSEEKLRELKQNDMLSELMAELGDTFPELKRVLIDERDMFLAEKIKGSPGKKIIAVVGAGHVAGLKERILEDNREKLEEIISIPPVSKMWKIVGWAVPITIIASLVLIGLKKGVAVAGANLLYWILANGIPCAIGSAVAFAHPLTIVSGFLAAPITSLTPVIGAGYVTAFVQVMVKPPIVMEFEQVGDDISHVSRWWKNKLLRVFLVFFLSGLGSAVGTYVGGYEIIKNLFN